MAYQYQGAQIIPLGWLPTWEDRGGGYFGLNNIGAYDPSLPLVLSSSGGLQKTESNVIGVDWSTFYGDDGEDKAGAIYCDDNNNCIVATNLGSAKFPLENNVKYSLGGNSDILITKFTGAKRIWTTVIGGDNIEDIFDIDEYLKNDAMNGLYFLVGHTSSKNFPKRTKFQNEFHQQHSSNSYLNYGLILSLKKQTGVINYTTEIGSASNHEWITCLSIDDITQKLFFGGSIKATLASGSGIIPQFQMTCTSPNNIEFPLCNSLYTGSYQQGSNVGGNFEGFIGSLNIASNTLEWSTPLGGGRSDEVSDIYVLKEFFTKTEDYKISDIFIVGSTNSISIDAADETSTSFTPPISGPQKVNFFPLVKSGANSYFQRFLNSANSNANYQNASPYDGFYMLFDHEYRLVHSTFIGGDDEDEIRSMAYSSHDGAVYMTGLHKYSQNTSHNNSNLANKIGAYPVYNGIGNPYFYTPSSNNYGNYNSIIKIIHDQLNWSTLFGDPLIRHAEVHQFPRRSTKIEIDGIGNQFIVSAISKFPYSSSTSVTPTNIIYNSPNRYNRSILPGNDKNEILITAFDLSNNIQWSTLFGADGNQHDVFVDFSLVGSSYLVLNGYTTVNTTSIDPYNQTPSTVSNPYIDHSSDGIYRDAFIARLNTQLWPTNVKRRSIESELIAYPNPASQSLIIKTPENDNIIWFQIYDVTGRLIKHSQNLQYIGGIYQIDLDNIISGIYYIEVITQNNKKYSTDFIKN